MSRSDVFHQQDVEDLTQICLEHWWRRRQRFDPTKASRQTFLKRITQNRLRSLARTERRRRTRGVWSLDEPVGLLGRLRGELTESPEVGPAVFAERTELSSRVHAVYGELDATDREVAERLGRGMPKSAIAVELRIGRTAVYRSMERMQKIFRAEGLEKFLD